MKYESPAATRGMAGHGSTTATTVPLSPCVTFSRPGWAGVVPHGRTGCPDAVYNQGYIDTPDHSDYARAVSLSLCYLPLLWRLFDDVDDTGSPSVLHACHSSLVSHCGAEPVSDTALCTSRGVGRVNAHVDPHASGGFSGICSFCRALVSGLYTYPERSPRRCENARDSAQE